jgi:hypothetical protein
MRVFMRKIIVFLPVILLFLFSSCSDTSMGRSLYEEDPVELNVLSRGEVLQSGESLEIEYSLNDTETVLDRVEIRVVNSMGEVIEERIIEDAPREQYIDPFELSELLPEGRYVLILDFYSEGELYYKEQREFFITQSSYIIRSVNSYPPVLYPGGGGLLSADVENSADGGWLRWTLDGSVVAEGQSSDGYKDIVIDAPENQGVYELKLEVFPFPPPSGETYDFESVLSKSIPLYVNREQTSGVNELTGPDDFFALFHFRGNYINSAEPELSGIGELEAAGSPRLAVHSGILGYYLDGQSGFKTDKLVLPSADSGLQSFSLMLSVIPYSLEGGGNIFYSGTADGSFYMAVDVLDGGILRGELKLEDSTYNIFSSMPLLTGGEYTLINLKVQIIDGSLSFEFFKNGVPDSGILYPLNGNLQLPDGVMTTSFFGRGGFTGLIDEAGIYYSGQAGGAVMDPDQYRRAMELEYGKFLMYAEGFDGELTELTEGKDDVSIDSSTLIIGPGASVEFPPIYPGYEKVNVEITFSDLSTRNAEAVFYPEEGETEVFRLDFYSESEEENPFSFAMIFTSEGIETADIEPREEGPGAPVDFSGLSYSILNKDEEHDLEIESILITRKSINMSKAGISENVVGIDEKKGINSNFSR